MKKLVLIVAFAIFGAAGLMAQETTKKCSKGEASKCCASKKAGMAEAKTVDFKVDADLTQVMSASMKRQGVTKRQCADTGAVSYYQSETCSKSGKVSYNEVEFDSETRQFVNKSPNDIGDANAGSVIKVVNAEQAATGTKKAGCCSKNEMKKCGSAKKTMATEGAEEGNK